MGKFTAKTVINQGYDEKTGEAKLVQPGEKVSITDKKEIERLHLAQSIDMDEGQEAAAATADSDPAAEYNAMKADELQKLLQDRKIETVGKGSGTNGALTKADAVKLLVDADAAKQ